MITGRISLIPRYNWDYSFLDWVEAASAPFQKAVSENSALKDLFGLEPVYTSSGRTSLYSILKALKLPEGSGIGVPLFCCPVVFDAIGQAGLVPVFLDIDPENYNLSPSDLERKKSLLAAVVVVHMFGHPADMDAISSVSGDVPVIEDCAQSLFSRYKGKYAGFLSNVSFFSFRSGKYVSAGEGSAVFSKDPDFLDTIKSLVASYEIPSLFDEILHCTSTYVKSTLYRRPWYGTIGHPVGTRLDRRFNLTAKDGFSLHQIAKTDLKIINARLRHFSQKVERQRENALYLLKHIEMKDVELPRERDDCRSNYYQFSLRFRTEEKRDLVADVLFGHGIDAAKYLDEVVEVASSKYHYKGDCPVAAACSKTNLVIPNHYTLSKKDLDHIVKTLNVIQLP